MKDSNMFRMIFILLIGFSIMGLTACSNSETVVVSKPFPSLQKKGAIAVFAFENYTDTPQAGKRAANLMEGLLNAKGYDTVREIGISKASLVQKRILAKEYHARFLLVGGVSEWRYKTGIDGEPAVSLAVKLLDVQSGSVLWSATGSDNSWGNASIGTTAQTLLAQMINRP